MRFLYNEEFEILLKKINVLFFKLFLILAKAKVNNMLPWIILIICNVHILMYKPIFIQYSFIDIYPI